MKTLQNTLIAAAASLLLIPAAKAQTVPYYVNESNGIAYNKYIKDGPDENGQYTIRIETFATGEVTMESKVVPADIVLVLDNSGSMYYAYINPAETDKPLSEKLILDPDFSYYAYNNGYPSINEENGRGSGTGTPIRIFSEQGPRYILYEGEYYNVTGGGSASAGYYLTFKTSTGATKYLDGEDVVDTRPTNYKNQASIIYRKKLYGYPTRKAILEQSVSQFIKKIDENNKTLVLDEGVQGNRVAIVAFGGDYHSTARQRPIQAYTGSSTLSNSFVVKKFTPVANYLNAQGEVTNPLSKMSFTGATFIDWGTQMARVLIEEQEASETWKAFVEDEDGNLVPNRSKSVIVFTDGSPNHSAVTSGSYQAPAKSYWELVSLSIDDGQYIKNIGGKIFTIGLNTNTNNEPYMRHLSSNYPKTETTLKTGGVTTANRNSFTGDPLRPEARQIYYQDAGKQDLSKVFDAIAKQTGGGNTEVSSSSIAAIDLVSNSFQLPAGTVPSDVKVYTAQCLGITDQTWTDSKNVEHPYLAFAEPIIVDERAAVPSIWVSEPKKDDQGQPVTDADGNPEYEFVQRTNVDIDAEISVDTDTDDNTVTVTGFNYGDYWCGLDPDEQHYNSEQYDSADYPDTYVLGYRGFKIIIEFKIQAKDGALGGPNVPTNLTGSGLYDKDGNTLAEYPQPHLPIPVNLWIQKKGLKPGESASFTILRKPDPDTAGTGYVPFTQILLTGSADGQPVMGKLLNLDPSFHYKIWEDGWSWAYTNQAQDQGTAPSTEDPELKNPIVIENTPKDDTPKHAEAAKRNVLKKND